MKIETKYDIGQEVWEMSMNRPHCTTIMSIHIGKDELLYSLKHFLIKKGRADFPHQRIT